MPPLPPGRLERRKAIARLVLRAMAQRDMGVTDLRKAARVGSSATTPLLAGDPEHHYRLKTRSNLSRALGWRAEALGEMLDDNGPDPDEVDTTPPSEIGQAAAAEPEPDRARAVRYIQRTVEELDDETVVAIAQSWIGMRA